MIFFWVILNIIFLEGNEAGKQKGKEGGREEERGDKIWGQGHLPVR